MRSFFRHKDIVAYRPDRTRRSTDYTKPHALPRCMARMRSRPRRRCRHSGSRLPTPRMLRNKGGKSAPAPGIYMADNSNRSPRPAPLR